MQDPAPAAKPPRSSLWRPGAMVGGRYRLSALIGAGAMGEVWRAEHATLGTTVAVKLVDTTGRDDAAEQLARFTFEARAAAQLRSPHVVQIVDHGADGPTAFMAMELLEGESLEQRLARRGALTPSEVAQLAREIARGLDRAHAAGIVHRDLKPPNVFIARVDGVEVAKILDFGIAKMLGPTAEAQVQTHAGFILGTPAYMSPEQVLGRTVDPRSDLWQLAVVSFECLTGKRPFQGATLGQLFMAICTQPMPVPSAFASVPPGFDAWFARAADRDPAGRFASATEMADALGAVLAPGGVGESALPTAVSRSAVHLGGGTGHSDAWSTAPVVSARRAPPTALIAGFLLAPAMALVGGGAFLVFRGHAPAPAAVAAPTPAATSATPAAAAPPSPASSEAPASPTTSPSASASSDAKVRPRPPARPPARAPGARPVSAAKPTIDLGI